MRVDGPPIRHVDETLWISELPETMAARHRDKVAIICHERTATYGDLERGSAILARLWTESGYRPGDRIAYLGQNNELFYHVLFACARAGFVLSSFNWRYAPPELAYVIDDARPRLLIHDERFRGLVEAALAQSNTKPATLLTEGGGDGSLRGLLERPPVVFATRSVNPEEPLYLFYTSGTTGVPKGVSLSHRAVAVARQSDKENPRWEDWGENDVLISPMPIFHTTGANFGLRALVVGGTCIMTADPSSANILRLLRTYKVDHLNVVSNLLRLLIDEIAREGSPAPRIGHIHYGAAPMSPSLLQEAIATFGCKFTQYYGMTEAGGTTHFLAPGEHDLARSHLLRSVGLPVNGVSIEIRRPDDSPCEVDEAGEIWIRTDTVMSGYVNKPRETAEALIDGWYRTGDGGRIDAQGYLYLTDRIKDMIITGGENVYPVEVENVLRAHPLIIDAAVVGLDDEKWGSAVTAILEARPGFDLSFDDVRNYVRENIAGYKCPRAVYLADALPRTPSGKIRRREARQNIASFKRI